MSTTRGLVHYFSETQRLMAWHDMTRHGIGMALFQVQASGWAGRQVDEMNLIHAREIQHASNLLMIQQPPCGHHGNTMRTPRGNRKKKVKMA